MIYHILASYPCRLLSTYPTGSIPWYEAVNDRFAGGMRTLTRQDGCTGWCIMKINLPSWKSKVVNKWHGAWCWCRWFHGCWWWFNHDRVLIDIAPFDDGASWSWLLMADVICSWTVITVLDWLPCYCWQMRSEVDL